MQLAWIFGNEQFNFVSRSMIGDMEIRATGIIKYSVYIAVIIRRLWWNEIIMIPEIAYE